MTTLNLAASHKAAISAFHRKQFVGKTMSAVMAEHGYSLENAETILGDDFVAGEDGANLKELRKEFMIKVVNPAKKQIAVILDATKTGEINLGPNNYPLGKLAEKKTSVKLGETEVAILKRFKKSTSYDKYAAACAKTHKEAIKAAHMPEEDISSRGRKASVRDMVSMEDIAGIMGIDIS